MPGPSSQLAFDLVPHPALDRADFLEAPSNSAALAAILQWRNWPQGRMALCGPAGAGKSHLAQVWRHASGASAVAAVDLREDMVPELVAGRGVVVEDVPAMADLPAPARRAAEAGLFHLYNHAAAEKAFLLLSGRAPPAYWPIAMADLNSRLQAVPMVAISAPDDTLLSCLLVKLFSDRQIHVHPQVIDYLLVHIERSFNSAENIVARLDRISLARRRPVTRALAREVLSHDKKWD